MAIPIVIGTGYGPDNYRDRDKLIPACRRHGIPRLVPIAIGIRDSKFMLISWLQFGWFNPGEFKKLG